MSNIPRVNVLLYRRRIRAGNDCLNRAANVERVEVIKGPQAALYGRATFSGAINYVTRRPTNELEGQVTVTVAEHSTTNTNAYVSGPIVEDSLYFYLGAGFNEYGGEYNNTISGEKVGGEEP